MSYLDPAKQIRQILYIFYFISTTATRPHCLSWNISSNIHFLLIKSIVYEWEHIEEFISGIWFDPELLSSFPSETNYIQRYFGHIFRSWRSPDWRRHVAARRWLAAAHNSLTVISLRARNTGIPGILLHNKCLECLWIVMFLLPAVPWLYFIGPICYQVFNHLLFILQTHGCNFTMIKIILINP